MAESSQRLEATYGVRVQIERDSLRQLFVEHSVKDAERLLAMVGDLYDYIAARPTGTA
jgi:hypothetical protein